MEQHTRRAIAYVAGSITTNGSKHGIYDYSSSRYYSFSGNIDAKHVSIYDHDEKCYIQGLLPNLYHFGNSKSLMLEIIDNKINGYDYYGCSHFSGTISGNNINIFDYKLSKYFNYSI